MAKLMLLSVLVASVAIPANAAKGANPRAGLKKSLVQVALFNVFYLLWLCFGYGHI
jgi:hypothetical protein